LHPLGRAILLWLVGMVSITTPLVIYSTASDYSVWEVLRVMDIFRVTTVASMLSFMFPAAYYGANNGEWGEHPELAVFLFTSFIVLPLMMIFPVDEQNLDYVFMDRDIPVWGFMVLWWGHGAVNALHVRILRQRSRYLNSDTQ
jgi:hypothetical protein